VDREFLSERCGKLPPKNLALVMNGIDVVLGRLRPSNPSLQPTAFGGG
jgi:hypothetical protein